MSILQGIRIVDLALSIGKTLIIADTHIGYEEALNKQGILVPRFQFKEIIERLEGILKRINPSTIIINGDIKHEFGTISDQEWRHTLRLLDFLAKYCKKVVLIKGNHDTILGPIAKKRNVRILDHLILSCPPKSLSSICIGGLTDKYKKLKKINDEILIIHGDKIPDKKLLKGVKTIIIAHEHPAVALKEGPRQELYKAFLKGKWKKYNLIVQPSFNLVTEGTDIVKEELLSPFLKQDLGNFRVWIIADRVYEFWKLKNIK